MSDLPAPIFKCTKSRPNRVRPPSPSAENNEAVEEDTGTGAMGLVAKVKSEQKARAKSAAKLSFGQDEEGDSSEGAAAPKVRKSKLANPSVLRMPDTLEHATISNIGPVYDKAYLDQLKAATLHESHSFDDNSEKLILCCRPIVMQDKDNEEFENTEEDIFVCQIEHNMLDSVTLCSVKNIRQLFMVEHGKPMIGAAGELQPRSMKEWMPETDGVNFKNVLGVDGLTLRLPTPTSELCNGNAIDFDSSYVNYSRLALLTDLMTNRGTLMASTRQCINQADTGALMRCSSEETVEILMEAATVGEKDDCYSVTENVLFGQMAPMGTGSFHVALDLDMLKDVIVNQWLPIQNMMATRMGGGMTPAGGLSMTPYDCASPMQAEAWKSEGAAFLALRTSADEGLGNFPFPAFPQSPMGQGRFGGGYSPSSPGYSPTSLATFLYRSRLTCLVATL
ncbi:DNA-directed RNA polymerase II subunit A [Rhizoctonia solani]|uniref:DNA-directed RNA polymerase n=1 Tax=Rhizoctonia solani TaxID=456999 RepID=A0A0K6G2D9_9AGAM|nr:DNA-directed RNA polymerase II subunit A [Rhizoctonia solani]